MQLHLKRSQRTDPGWLTDYITFILEVRLELTPDEERRLHLYPHRHELIYEGEGYVYCQERVRAHLKYAEEGIPATPKDPGLFDYAHLCFGITMGVVNVAAGVGFSVASLLCLQIDLLTLRDGHYIESQSLEELLDIEDKVTTAVDYFSQFLKVADYFDGSEYVSEYS